MTDAAKSKHNLTPAQQAAISDLFYDLCQGKETRAEAARLIKKSGLDPVLARQFTDIELEDRLAEERTRREQEEIKENARQAVAHQAAQRAKLLEPVEDGKPRYSEDQVKEIEKLMEKHGTGDYTVGAILYRDAHPSPAPAVRDEPRHGATWEFPSLGNMKFEDFAKDPVKASRDAAYNVIAEFGKGRRAA